MTSENKVIYGLIDGDTLELRYIGQTCQLPEVRLVTHRRRGNPHLRNWLACTHVNIIVLERNPEDLNEAEIKWIREMREQGARLLNMTDGGFREGYHPTTEMRKKMGLSKRGIPLSAEHRAKISTAKRGCPKNAEHREKISTALKGRRFTLEHCTNISAARQKYFKSIKSIGQEMEALSSELSLEEREK